MKIIEKFKEKQANIHGCRQPVIAFLGDSVTQGCFECYKTEAGGIETIFDKNGAYHRYLDQIFSVLYPNVPTNIINAATGGKTTSAQTIAKRAARNALSSAMRSSTGAIIRGLFGNKK